MATTPPPPRRVHTPPTPLHGAKDDEWLPYSPRRSNRVAAQRVRHDEEQFETAHMTPATKRVYRTTMREGTPARSNASSQASQAISPPVSPTASPLKQFSVKKRGQRYPLDSDSDLDSAASRLDPFAPSSSLLDVTMGDNMPLPTPAKTPRKRPAQNQSSLNSTARVLFQSRPATIDEVMPEPRKTRKGNKHAAFSLGSFADECEGNGSKIEIYTDSKERVPSPGTADENPFLSNYKPKQNKKAKASKPKRQADVEMEEAVKNNEGFISTFRGKKFLRRFSETESGSDTDNSMPGRGTNTSHPRRMHVPSDFEPAHTGRLTRSSIKPRLLFPNEAQRREREEREARQLQHTATDADEEATTDIEAPIMARAKTNRKLFTTGPTSFPASRSLNPFTSSGMMNQDTFGTSMTSAPASYTSTPAKSRTRDFTTPPPTFGRVTRSATKKDAADVADEEATTDEDGNAGSQSMPTPPDAAGAGSSKTPSKKKLSPFDGWKRTKGRESSGPGEGGEGKGEKGEKKRVGETLIKDGVRKRVRSGQGGSGGL
ncbi:hypothetical protein K490DRAFT_68210 [Saccharata proteae CBS 121410]|uniref:Uncharacterized protein n=1 Tax=Saccharata proteae CBS 121410 TaxID=1314787 RepID=A0A9P4HS63_9PEZI|nr:hypothetical protein K490DRAFT_68210 [Saccharata proteae CBS 121410]